MGVSKEVEPLHFGTGGIRAVMGPARNQLNVQTVARISQAVADWLLAQEEAPTVAIARDCREHGEEFMHTAAEILAANGIKVKLLPNVQPTPVLCFAVRDLGCSAGIVITASHNARDWNGYKVYDRHGCQATDDIAHAIQAHLDSGEQIKSMASGHARECGLLSWVDEDLVSRYAEAAAASVPGGFAQAPLQMVYSPLHGTGGAPFLQIMKRLGIDSVQVVASQAEPDGSFPTCPLPNPEDPAALEMGMRVCTQTGAGLLLANDPDADRVGVGVLHDGVCHQLSGDEVALLLLDWMCRWRVEAGLPLEGMVAYATIVTTPLADSIARRWGIELRRTLTGFKYIGEQVCLLEEAGEVERFLLGIEESCGYLTGAYIRDKDGMSGAAAIALMAMWHERRGNDLLEALEQLYEEYGWCGSRQLNTRVEDGEVSATMGRLRSMPPKQLGDARIMRAVDYSQPCKMPTTASPSIVDECLLPSSDVLEFDLEHGCRVMIRPSGTEPKLKAYVFAQASSRALMEERLVGLVRDVRGLLESANG